MLNFKTFDIQTKKKIKKKLKCCGFILYPLKQIETKLFYHLFYDFVLAGECTLNIYKDVTLGYKYVNEIEIDDNFGIVWSNLLDKQLSFDTLETYCERLESLGDSTAKQLSDSLKECSKVLTMPIPFSYLDKHLFETEQSILQYLKNYFSFHQDKPLCIVSLTYNPQLKSYRCTSLGTNFYFLRLQTDYLEEIYRYLLQNGILTCLHFGSSQEYYKFWTNIVNSMIFNQKRHKQFQFPVVIKCKENKFLNCRIKLKYLYFYNKSTDHTDMKFILKLVINPDQLNISNYLLQKSKFQMIKDETVKINQQKYKKCKKNILKQQNKSFKQQQKEQQCNYMKNIILNSQNINYENMPEMSKLFLQLFYQNNYEMMIKQSAQVKKI